MVACWTHGCNLVGDGGGSPSSLPVGGGANYSGGPGVFQRGGSGNGKVTLGLLRLNINM